MLDVGRDFDAGRRYLNTASVGIPPSRAVSVLRDRVDDWAQARTVAASFDPAIDRARVAYGALVASPVEDVAIVGQVSVATGVVASSLHDGATVLCAEEDFTSVLFPFLNDPRLDVVIVPLDDLIDRIDTAIDLVAVSAVQSADGRVIDLDHLAAAAAAADARTYLDVTQAAGWLPMQASHFDVTSCGAYKWLCSPRGTGFMTVRPDADWLLPHNAGWYAGERPWDSIYGPPLRLAADARRFSVSPAWLGYAAAAEAIEYLSTIGVHAIHDHDVALANRFRRSIGLDESTSAIVSIETDRGPALGGAGITTAARAGKVRLSFHLYNDMADADAAADVVAG